MIVETTSDATRLTTASVRLMEIAFGFVNSQALLSAHELGVFEVLGESSMTPAALSERIEGDIACVPGHQVARWRAALGPLAE